MRTRYRARREALEEALRREFGANVEISLQAGGLHLLARFSKHGRDVELARLARERERGLMPHPLSGQSIEHDAGEGLLMSFTNIQEHQAADIVSALRRSIE